MANLFEGRSICEAARRPVVGIVPTQVLAEDILRISSRYVEALSAAGAAPIVIPPVVDERIYETLFPQVDAFVLTGGNDIDPRRYGVENLGGASSTLTEATPQREDLEFFILSYAYEFDVPVLGICRGMQMINVFFGGSLYLDVPSQFSDLGHWQDEPYDRVTHFVDLEPASKIGRIFGVERLGVNSMHHQGVRKVAPVLDVAAHATDGLVEAVELRDRSFIAGVQWHPEYFADTKGMGCLFDELVRQARASRARLLERGCSVLHIKRANDLTSWPLMSYADGI